MNIDRAKAEFGKYAEEPIDVQNIGGTFYAFGSELACLRIFYAYRRSGEAAACDFSKNLNTWYFRLEMAL